MTDEEWESLVLLMAAERRSGEGRDERVVAEMRLQRDTAKAVLVTLLPTDAKEALAGQTGPPFGSSRFAPHPEPDPMGFRDTAIVIGVATAAAIAAAPLGAWLVKELTVNALFVGAATRKPRRRRPRAVAVGRRLARPATRTSRRSSMRWPGSTENYPDFDPDNDLPTM
ncbi:hypothetical protein KOI35_46485 [Actinoplanes bogorensis]|uniref:DUF1707 domain-containing protein n=1 Tax=Paractinoplanes bogorensis TaxID=1610840 RepID=A0ABS5Z6F2_9ACTN|nr:hypothetical protein [Actinoplanes bogorensis]MBU2670971.1 hypothetical protein [Actinoplanes bogorensis]